jgi:hypothetical protein
VDKSESRKVHARERFFRLFAFDKGGDESEMKKTRLSCVSLPPKFMCHASGNADNSKTKARRGGGVRYVGDDNRIMPQLSSRIIASMKGRTVLSESELEVLSCLQNIYQITNPLPKPVDNSCTRAKSRDPVEISQEFLDAVSPRLKSKKELSNHKMRLLGMLAIVAFHSAKDGTLISVRNLSRAKPIRIALMPRQYKGGDVLRNSQLYIARIKTRKLWMGHLPRESYDDVVAALVDDMNKDKAKHIIRKYQNKCLRLNPQDSVSLKAFVGMNNNQYVRLMRSLFYFAGMRILAPIKGMRVLRDSRIKSDYTTLMSNVRDMTRVTKNGKSKITRKIKVNVVTI